jgi:3'(2'), 5'-bisphosphate nucleotidase
MNYVEFIEPIVELARKAGDAILEVYASDFDVQSKDDESPLTQADLAAHRRIIAGLAELTPDLPVISEEGGLPPFETRGQWPTYWLIDPLDGTKEFVNRNGEFTVNVALVNEGRPVFGVVHVPVLRKTYVGCEGHGAELRAEGGADVYPRLGPTSEWDTAAAQAVVEQAGGSVVTLDGKPMKYNQKEDILNPYFMVIGAADHDWLALLPDRE